MGQVYHQFYPGKIDFSLYLSLVSVCLYMHWYFLIYPYELTISNGLSLATLNSKEFTQCSGSFEWGGHCQFYLGKSENLSLFQVLLLLHRALLFLEIEMKDQ